jgi:two-component system chemotaxis response regulator CheY
MDALAEILALDPTARVLVVSAIADAASVTQALKAGARGYVHKPLRTQDGGFVDRFRQEIADALDDSLG